MVDDMFLTLDSSFTDDFEKIKRIASDVQQFCITDDFTEMITEVAIPSNTASIVTTTAMPQQDIVTTSSSGLINSRPSTTTAKTNKPTKKYKRSPNHNNNNSINVNNNNLTNSNGNMNLNAAINGQRKERSLHYCSICSKGFKDKYSVNVHHRTHTGTFRSSHFLHTFLHVATLYHIFPYFSLYSYFEITLLQYKLKFIFMYCRRETIRMFALW